MQVGGVVLGPGKPGVLFMLEDTNTPAHHQRVFTQTTPVFEVDGVERGDWTPLGTAVASAR